MNIEAEYEKLKDDLIKEREKENPQKPYIFKDADFSEFTKFIDDSSRIIVNNLKNINIPYIYSRKLYIWLGELHVGNSRVYNFESVSDIIWCRIYLAIAVVAYCALFIPTVVFITIKTIYQILFET